MMSAWFWNTKKWAQYQDFYYSDGRPRVEEYKSSPLADDHDFNNCFSVGETALDYDEFNEFDFNQHCTQVIDLRKPLDELWRGIRKSYRPLINKALKDYTFSPGTLTDYHRLHTLANGRETRSQGTWDCMGEWLADGYGGLVLATKDEVLAAGAYFILYQGSAYYASGASLVDNVQHAVIWTAIKQLKASGIHKLELGQINGETEKEKSIGVFKSGFGGKSMPFTIARRRT